MLERIRKPYSIKVSDTASRAGFFDTSFSNKVAARLYILEIRKVDPNFTYSLRNPFRYRDTATGELFTCKP